MWHDLISLALDELRKTDRAAWRRFFIALFGLGLSLFLALYATALSDSGRYVAAAVIAAIALALAGIVAYKTVPYLARRTALERWAVHFQYEFTREGAVYLGLIAVIAVAALNTGNNLLFIILATLLAGILVSGVFSKIVLEKLALDLTLPEHIFASRPLVAQLTLGNNKLFFPSFSMTVTASEAGGRARRKKGPVKASRAILSDPVYVPFIPRRASVTQRVELLFPDRGRYSQEGFRVGTKFPFGFLRKVREISSRQEILALPNVERSQEFDEALRLIGAEQESYLKGHGHDLYAIRDYQENDPARHVDWKATAKAQQLKVREFTREDERRLAFVFDNRVPQLDEAARKKFESGVTLCAALAWHFFEAEARMSFRSPNSVIPLAPASEVIFPLLEKLALIEPEAWEGPMTRMQAESAEPDEPIFSIVFAFGESHALVGIGGSLHPIRMDLL